MTSAEYEIKLRDLFSGTLANIEKKMNAFETKLNQVNSSASKMGNNMGSVGNIMSGVFGGIGLASAANWAIHQIESVSESIISLGTDMEKTRISFTTMFRGNASLADSMIGRFQKFAQETPFNTQDVLAGARKLTAAKVAIQDIIPVMRKLGDIASGTGQRFDYLTFLYQHTKGLGHLSKRLLNEFQLAGIDIQSELENKYHVNGDKLHKMISEGKISFQDVDKALTAMTSKGGQFFELNDKLSKSTAGRWERLKDTIEIIQTKMGEQLNPTWNKFLDDAFEAVNKFAHVDMSHIINALENVEDTAKRIADIFQYLMSQGKTSNGNDWTFGGDVQAATDIGNNMTRAFQLLLTKLTGGTSQSWGDFFDDIKKRGKATNKSDEQRRRAERDKQISQELDAINNPYMDASKKGYIYKSGGSLNNDDDDESTKIGIDKMQSATKNITLNIDKLVEKIVFERADVNGNEQAMVEAVKKVLLTAVNDVNMIA